MEQIEISRLKENANNPRSISKEKFMKLDGSKEGDIVLDVFGGSGTTMVAAEQLGRCARLMELDPHYCDVIVSRWERLTGNKAIKVN